MGGVIGMLDEPVKDDQNSERQQDEVLMSFIEFTERNRKHDRSGK
jgi:hypothetical protein